MNVAEAKSELKRLLSRLRPAELTQLLGWMKNSDELEDELLGDNGRVLLQSIAEDLRANVAPDAMLACETAAYSKMQRRSRPTVHVDGFLYDDEQVDSLCERGLMSRNYCLSCGSHRTAPLDFISHSFSVTELRFLFQHVLPDLSGRTLVDVGSRLGAVLYGVRGQHTHTHTCCRVFVTVEDIRTTVLLPNKWSCTDLQEDFPGTRADAQTFGLNALL
uniref:Zgc:109986 n=1 Tax=Haplochromis burtoni TaxID=8153 RepID=A0A3Q2W656_HAPBU